MTDYRILRAERTGYGYPVHEESFIGYCSVCGKPIYEYDRYEEQGFIDPDLVCEDCIDIEREDA